MKFFPRLPGFGLLSVLLTALLLSCETAKQGTGEFGSPTRTKGEVVAKPESRQIAHVTDSITEFKTPRPELARAFIRQFGDGTVVDKIMVRKAPGGPKTGGQYFLVGLGLRSGSFRAMALPLTSGGDNTYYLRPSAERYIITSVGCPTCFFNFEDGRIVGTSCVDNSGGSRCDLKIEANNELFTNK
jgi:hypothetical protein